MARRRAARDRGDPPATPATPATTLPDGAVLGIAAAAARAGLSRRAPRHYESLGLVRPAGRRSGYFRLYAQSDVHRLERIAALRRLLGLTLEQARPLLEAEDLSERTAGSEAGHFGVGAGIIERHVHLLREREALTHLLRYYERLLPTDGAPVDAEGTTAEGTTPFPGPSRTGHSLHQASPCAEEPCSAVGYPFTRW